MSVKNFNLLAVTVLMLSLVFVPIKFCAYNNCIFAGWGSVFDISPGSSIDITRLIVQEILVGLGLFGVWQFVTKEE